MDEKSLSRRGSGRNPNFDWLRLFLAASVTYFHAGAYSRGVNGQDVPWGAIPFPMVPTFLALSGFLMLDSIARSHGWLDFWRKRALRILPALIAALLLSWLAWGWHVGVLGSLATYFGGGYLFGAQGDGSLWSLLWEEIAYALMAILVALSVYKRPRAIWAALVVSCVVALHYNQHEPIWRLANLAPALFTGNLVRIYRNRIARWDWRIILAATVAITTALKVMGVPPQSWFMVPVGAALALSLCLTMPNLPRLPGDISYGLYVFHDPIFALVARISPATFGSFVLLGAPCLVVIACLSWVIVEHPALRLKKKTTRNAGDRADQSSQSSRSIADGTPQ